MAATTIIRRRIGTTGAPTDIDVTAAGVKFTVDDSNTGTTPVQIPASGAVVQTSVPANLVLYVSTAVGSVISNKRLSYGGAAMPTGYGFFMNTEGTSSNVTSATYAQNTTAVTGVTTTIGSGSLGTVNYVWMGGGVAGTTTQYDSTSATISSNGVIAGKYCKVCVVIDSTATSTGTVTMPTISLTYDES